MVTRASAVWRASSAKTCAAGWPSILTSRTETCCAVCWAPGALWAAALRKISSATRALSGSWTGNRMVISPAGVRTVTDVLPAGATVSAVDAIDDCCPPTTFPSRVVPGDSAATAAGGWTMRSAGAADGAVGNSGGDGLGGGTVVMPRRYVASKRSAMASTSIAASEAGERMSIGVW